MAAKIDVSFISGRLAKDKDGRSYYFAGDSEKIYLFATKNELNDNLKAILDYSYSLTDVKPESYKVTGFSKEIPDKLKTIVLDAYNKLFPNQNIEEEEFYSYIGNYYLDEEKIFDEKEDLYFTFLIVSIIIMIVFAVFSIISLFK